MAQIWTIGHSTRSLIELLDMLHAHSVGVLIDVRSYPSSRRCPHFNLENLAREIPVAGIEYTHILDLGGRRRASKTSLNTTWRHPAFRGYADHMETPIFARGVERLESLASDARACYMCSEAWYVKCHRSMISDHLASRNWDVRHINGIGPTKPHSYTQPARVVDGVLTYRGQQAVLGFTD